MKALILKEIRSFFGSITGYVVVGVYLLINSSFLWIFSNSFNVLDSGYATIENLFIISPWVFLFLIPAITMRMFSDEKKAGTMELLLTKPLSDLQIVYAKIIAGVLLVVVSVLPTLLYFYSIYMLGNPVGNIDIGGTIGSYIGLVFLGCGFVSIGVFASALTDNQIIAFLLAVFLCLFFHIGFDTIADLGTFSSVALFVKELGINEHYLSLSRGVIDSRDVIYFVGLVIIFGLATRLVIQSRKW